MALSNDVTLQEMQDLSFVSISNKASLECRTITNANAPFHDLPDNSLLDPTLIPDASLDPEIALQPQPRCLNSPLKVLAKCKVLAADPTNAVPFLDSCLDKDCQSLCAIYRKNIQKAKDRKSNGNYGLDDALFQGTYVDDLMEDELSTTSKFVKPSKVVGKLINMKTKGDAMSRFAIQETKVSQVPQTVLNEVWKDCPFNGIQQENEKQAIWQQLSVIASNWSGPLCILGDFNSTCAPDERLREVSDHVNMANFNAFLVNANLFDQALQNAKFRCRIQEQRDLTSAESNLRVEAKLRCRRINFQVERKRMLSSRINWLKLGDKNTQFFHLVSKIRYNASHIAGIFNQESLLNISHINWPAVGLLKLSSQAASRIECPFVEEEISKVIGWKFLKDKLMLMMLQFHANANLPNGFNSTFIVLIPKVNNPKDVNQMRPISLINAPYKIIAKTLANRLRSVVPDLVSQHQNAFVPSRLLLDGVIVVNELWHSAKRMKQQIIFLKIDFSKAYDTVSHSFLLSVLDQMGFGFKFKSWIKACISNVKFSLLLNGSPTTEKEMKRGLRSKFPELYRLSRNRDGMINQFYFSPDGSLVSWNLDFSMPLSPYDSREAESLLLMLRNAILDISVEDSIVWNPSPVGEFSVSQ
ncbi:transposon TX1 uncharacterized, partial [Tanacetum coccineum]